jgi:type II secretory pathway component PulF
LFEGFQAALPLLTRIIVAVSDVLRHYGLSSRTRRRRDAFGLGRVPGSPGKHPAAWERVAARAPVVGPLAAKLAMARFCRMLGTLLGAGVPLMNGLAVARRSLGLPDADRPGGRLDASGEEGRALAASLADPALFPGSTLEMIAVAEESGRLDQELVRLAG